MNTQQLIDAREWLIDMIYQGMNQEWEIVLEEVDSYTNEQVIRYIERDYHGGINSFITGE